MEYADDEVAKGKKKVRDKLDLIGAEQRLRNGTYWAKGPKHCGTCKKEIRKPRIIRDITAGGKKEVTVSWCSQECADKWASQFMHSPKLARRVEHYDAEGNLMGYHIGGRFVSLEEIDRMEDEQTEEVNGDA